MGSDDLTGRDRRQGSVEAAAQTNAIRPNHPHCPDQATHPAGTTAHHPAARAPHSAADRQSASLSQMVMRKAGSEGKGWAKRVPKMALPVEAVAYQPEVVPEWVEVRRVYPSGVLPVQFPVAWQAHHVEAFASAEEFVGRPFPLSVSGQSVK